MMSFPQENMGALSYCKPQFSAFSENVTEKALIG